MKVSALTAYVDRKNIFNKTPLSLQSKADRKRIAESIDCDLSPENLTCDGEISRAEVNRRYRNLTAAAQELIKLDPTVAQYMYGFSYS
jgi:hypothetical protein